jgi:hypothetical protein
MSVREGPLTLGTTISNVKHRALHARCPTRRAPRDEASVTPSPPARRRPGPRRPQAAGPRPAPAPVPPVPLGHPAHLFALALAIVVVLISTSSRIYDTDLWQHLLVGKAIWTLHRVPVLQLWSWPTYGTVDVTSSYSWAFRALLWPFWSGLGVVGLFLLRWGAALATFALAWLTARRLGARDLPALLVFVIAALVFRQRAQVRPELVAAVLLAATQWILETRRGGGPDRSPLLIPLLWLWANLHVSYVLGFLVAGIHLAGDLRSRGRAAAAPGPSTSRLALCVLAAVPLMFVNPYGWRAVVAPFQFVLLQRGEPILRTIAELQPPPWKENLRNGLPLLLAGWPLLLLMRARRRGLDLVELLLCLVFTPLALRALRFVGPYAVVAAPFLARDLEDALSGVRWPAGSLGAWARAAAFAVPALVLGALEWSRPSLPLGIRVDPRAAPSAACDYMAARDVRGRGFTQFELGGYLLWRFWPDRSRLPFMDIHQSGTPEIRALYPLAFADPATWAEMNRRWRFDYVLLNRILVPGERLPDMLDADSTWALVFLDDRAALWVRRGSPASAHATADEYHLLSGGPARLQDLQSRWGADSALADRVARELRRSAASSTQSAGAWNLLARVEFSRGRLAEAKAALERAVAPDQERAPGAHGMLALIALLEDRPADAVAEARREQADSPRRRGMNALIARAYVRLGDLPRARAAWRRELAVDPENPEARDSLAALEGRF